MEKQLHLYTPVSEKVPEPNTNISYKVACEYNGKRMFADATYCKWNEMAYWLIGSCHWAGEPPVVTHYLDLEALSKTSWVVELLDRERDRLKTQLSSIETLIRDVNDSNSLNRLNGKIEGIQIAYENIRQTIKDLQHE